MSIDYPVVLDIRLQPIWHDNPPEINIGVNDNIDQVVLSDNQVFHYEFTASKTSVLTVELLNKTNLDTVNGLDKAVVIESVSFFGISDPKFIWLGEYRPEYPEPWFSEQTPKPAPLLKNHTYLGWNGKWTLTFTVPVFTWIHGVQNLGWIHN